MPDREMERLNLLPINQLAALKLKAAGVAADPALPAAFQLMLWGLDNGAFLTHHRTACELQRLCRSASPGAALDYLVTRVPGGMRELHKELLHLHPPAAAQLLLDLLDMRLKADPHNPYPADDPA